MILQHLCLSSYETFNSSTKLKNSYCETGIQSFATLLCPVTFANKALHLATDEELLTYL